jgi:hypothetical protein
MRFAPARMANFSNHFPSLVLGLSHPKEMGVSGIINLALAINLPTSKGEGG